MSRRPDLRIASPSEEPPEPRPSPASFVEWVDGWVLPYAREPQLWPALVALLGHVAVGIAGLLLIVVRTGSAAAVVVTAAFFAASVFLAAREMRTTGIGRATVALGLTWVGGVALAWFTGETGIF